MYLKIQKIIEIFFIFLNLIKFSSNILGLFAKKFPINNGSML
jgi:hypothetical protein